MGDMIDALKILSGKPARKSPLGRPGRRRDDSIKTAFKGIGYEDVN
jgi:hypothetical protein